MGSPATPATEQSVDANGVPLFTRTIGSGPDVVVLHGGPGAHHDYLLPQFDALAQERRLRYYDQRGGGRSPAPRDVAVGWREHVADLHALISEWGLSPATILGYSWGGLLALLFATEHPEWVGRLALVSTPPAHAAARREFERRLAERMQAPEIANAREELRQSGLRERDPDAYRQRAFQLAVAGYFAHPSRARSLTPFRVTGRTQTAVWQSLGDFDLRERIAALSVPALMIHGKHDAIPISSAEETAKLLGAELLVFQHSGHVPYVEETQHFFSVLNGFLPRAP